MVKTTIGLRICAASACLLATPAFADKSCFTQTFIEKWAEKFSIPESHAKEAVYSADMPEILDAIYDRYIGLAFEFEDAQTAFEAFEVKWNIDNHEANGKGYELVPSALRECVKWMWSD